MKRFGKELWPCSKKFGGEDGYAWRPSGPSREDLLRRGSKPNLRGRSAVGNGLIKAALSLLISGFGIDAQIVATLQRLPGGMDEVRLRNDSATSLAAFVITVNQVPHSVPRAEPRFLSIPIL